MKDWQFTVLFLVGVGSAILLLIGPEFGINISQNPTAVTGVGAILTYILTQRKTLSKPSVKRKRRPTQREDSDHSEEDEGDE